jgi:hypothetical protein
MVQKDTDPEAHALQIELMRGLGGPGRVELLISMSEQAREVSRAGIRARHPEYSEEQVHLALARLILGDELYREAFAGHELVHP